MNWKDTLPSKEHRAHIRRFLRDPCSDEEDVPLRGYVAWRAYDFALRTAKELVESGTDRSGKKPRK